jgi:hypothetical protein
MTLSEFPSDTLRGNLVAAREAEVLAARYSSFSRESAGMANVLGAVFVFVGAGELLPIGFIGRPVPFLLSLSAVLMPLAWIWCRLYLQRTYYQRAGGASQTIALYRWMRTFLITSLAIFVCAQTMLAALRDAEGLAGLSSNWHWIIYIVAAISAPVVAWKFLSNTSDFLVLLFLLMQAALVLTGGPQHDLPTLSIISLAFPASICALLLMIRGVREQLQFSRMEGEMPRLKEQF